MDQETLSAITAIASLVGAIGGLFAAIAAFRSAGATKNASLQAASVEIKSSGQGAFEYSEFDYC